MRRSVFPTPRGPESSQPDRRPLLSQLCRPIASCSSHSVSGLVRFSALVLAASLCAALLGAGVALGQVTTTSDDDPAPEGSLRFEVVLNQVLVRFTPGDDHTRSVIAAVQRDGTCWLGGTVWHGMAAMRISVSNWCTTESDIDRAADAILACADEVGGESVR